MSNKNRNYQNYYKQLETEATQEAPIEENIEEATITPTEDENLVAETEVTPTKIIQKTAAIVKGSPRVNMRAAANEDAKVLSVISENTAVKIIDDSNEYWFRIEVNGKVGYMMSKFLKRI